MAPLHASPEGVQPGVPGATATLHTPSAAPVVLVQRPPQHSVSVAQTSASCLQNDGAEQIPLAQYCEQQSPFAAQVLPEVLQDLLSGVQVPFAHCPPQHWSFDAHANPSEMHNDALHAPFTQLTLQQSVPTAHVAPDCLHAIAPAPRGPVGTVLPIAPPAPLVAPPLEEAAPPLEAPPPKELLLVNPQDTMIAALRSRVGVLKRTMARIARERRRFGLTWKDALRSSRRQVCTNGLIRGMCAPF